MQEFYLILHMFLLVFWANCAVSPYSSPAMVLVGSILSVFGATRALQKLMRRKNV